MRAAYHSEYRPGAADTSELDPCIAAETRLKKSAFSTKFVPFILLCAFLLKKLNSSVKIDVLIGCSGFRWLGDPCCLPISAPIVRRCLIFCILKHKKTLKAGDLEGFLCKPPPALTQVAMRTGGLIARCGTTGGLKGVRFNFPHCLPNLQQYHARSTRAERERRCFNNKGIDKEDWEKEGRGVSDPR